MEWVLANPRQCMRERPTVDEELQKLTVEFSIWYVCTSSRNFRQYSSDILESCLSARALAWPIREVPAFTPSITESSDNVDEMSLLQNLEPQASKQGAR